LVLWFFLAIDVSERGGGQMQGGGDRDLLGRGAGGFAGGVWGSSVVGG